MNKIILSITCLIISCQTGMVMPPEPVYPIPNQRQLDWQELEFYAFNHFNMNTFTNMNGAPGVKVLPSLTPLNWIADNG